MWEGAIILTKGNEWCFESSKTACLYKRKLVPIAPIRPLTTADGCAFFSYFRFNKLTKSQLQSKPANFSEFLC